MQSRFRQALALHRQGDLTAAEKAYREVLDQQPQHFDALHMLGVIALQTGRTERGVELVGKAIELNGSVAAAHNNLGKALIDLKRPEPALASFDSAIAIDPNFAEPHLNRGNALVVLNRAEPALQSYHQAIEIKPDFAEAHRNRGNVFFKLKRYADAFAAYDRAFALKPDLPGLESHRLYAKMHLCDWNGLDAERARLIASVRNGEANAQPFVFLAVSSSAEDQLRCSRSWVAKYCPASPKPIWRGERYHHDRIRMAYLSADFRQHPMAVLTAGMFEGHDRSRFEITAISFGADDNSDMRRRLMSSFEHFIDVRASSDEEISGLIRRLEIDIAVDLMGFTTDSRTRILARRPAPIQVHYLGYPGTMGAPYIDYVIADRVVIPAGQDESYSEKLVQLPGSYLVNDVSRTIAQRTFSRAELGLPEAGFVFCCFNNPYKITPDVFDRWIRILDQVRGSVLWLFQDDVKATDNLRKAAQARGVDVRRLIFADRMASPDHLARHRAADLFLDTLPYNAHTTASDALWTGLPVLTCPGDTFVGRVAASLLNAIDLPELVAETPQDYERLAVELATSPGRMAAVRRKLTANCLTTPLFDTGLFTRRIEAAYVAMYARHQAGLPPDHIVVEG